MPRRELTSGYWNQPARWNADAALSGARARVFCASMADVFENRRDLDARREKLWRVIEETPSLDWLLLTKRPQNIRKLAPWTSQWPGNVWLGATAENQKWLDVRVPFLVATSAPIIFLSCEPLLGPLNLEKWVAGARRGDFRKIDWVIGGGESGHNSRPMHPAWLMELRDQCVSAEIKFHFKQWGNWKPESKSDGRSRATRILSGANGECITMVNLGKKDAGRRLQGRTWDEFPMGIARGA
jgi:protein gp37